MLHLRGTMRPGRRYVTLTSDFILRCYADATRRARSGTRPAVDSLDLATVSETCRIGQLEMKMVALELADLKDAAPIQIEVCLLVR